MVAPVSDYSKALEKNIVDLSQFVNQKFKIDLDQAKDIVQETFYELLVKETDFSMEGLEKLLYTAVRNNAIDHLRRAKKEKRDNGRYLMDTASLPPDEPGENEEIKREVFRRLNNLPPEQRRAIVGTILKNKGHSE